MKELISIVLLLTMLFGCGPKQNLHYTSSNFELIKLADGVYACIHKISGKAISNAGIIDNGKETIIFDDFLSPKVAEELLLVVEQFGLSPIKYIVNSHYHNDHIRGNQMFSEDIPIISTTKTAELIEFWEPKEIEDEKSYAPRRFEYFDSLLTAYEGDSTDREYVDIQMWRPYFEILSESHKVVKTRLPNLFVDERKNIDGPMRKVQLFSNGKGHTESDLVLYLPDDQIIFTGDLVFNTCHPYLANGFPEEWKKYLTDLGSLNITSVVPGHGPVGNKEIIAEMRNYIISIEKKAKEIVEDGIPIEELENIEIPEPYKDWWFDIFFVSNLKFMYNKVQKQG